MISRTRTTKDTLWFLALFGLVAALFRLFFGLGATTNLSDMVPCTNKSIIFSRK